MWMDLPEMFTRCAVVVLLAASIAAATRESWVRLDKASPSLKVTLTFAVKQNDPQWLQKKLHAVSYPSSPEYTNYMNFDEIARHVYGKPESVEALLQTLGAVGISSDAVDFTIGRDFAVVSMPVLAVETLFSAEFYNFQHIEDTGWKIVSSANYTIPLELRQHLDFVSGISEFPSKNRAIASRKASAGVGTTPVTINSAYKINGYISTSPQNSQAIAGFLKQYFNEDDLKKFQKKYNIVPNPIAKIIGPNRKLYQGIEANLDVQYITATGQNVTTWFVSISELANKRQEDFLTWIVMQVNDTQSPWVHSVSYGDYENSIPLDYQSRCDSEFMKFGISGRSLFFASGDEGAHCKKRRFVPDWPACSPYITSVGGTADLDTVWEDGGGGFSDSFPMPDYQKEAVEAYLNSGKAPNTKYFNATGRAYPDVSAFSTGFNIIFADIDEEVGGTSCAAPTFAGIVSLLNDVRLKAGKKTLGFLNPLLYQTLKGNGFIDVTKGENSDSINCPGFKAIEGWDPASGWGQPDFSVLKTLV